MCMADPTNRRNDSKFGGAYMADDEYDKKLSEEYKSKYFNQKLYEKFGDVGYTSTGENNPEAELKQKIIDYRQQRDENAKAPRPTSAETVDENIQPKKKKQSKSSLGAVTKSRDRDSILSSLIKSDRNTLG